MSILHVVHYWVNKHVYLFIIILNSLVFIFTLLAQQSSTNPTMINRLIGNVPFDNDPFENVTHS